MSIYAAFYEGPGTDLASVRGWSEVLDWIESLPADEFPNLVHVGEHGYTEQVAATKAEIEASLVAHEPSADVKKTLELLAELLDNQDVLLITDGMGPDTD